MGVADVFWVWVHVLAAATWLGGLLFIGLVLVPVMRSADYGGQPPEAISRAILRFRSVAWINFAVLAASGFLLLVRRAPTPGASGFWHSEFGRLLTIKLFLVGVILLSSAVHDFSVGPRAARTRRADPASARARRLGQTASWMARLNLLLTMIVVLLAVRMVRGGG